MECFINLRLSSSRPFLGWVSRRLDDRSLGISAMKESDEVYNPDDVIEVDDDFDFDTLISETFDHGRENPKDDILEPPSLANVMQKMKDQHEAEVMKLRERIDELEIEKVQTDIDKMEMEAEIKDLETKVCKCSKIFVNEGENSSVAGKMTVEQCLKIITIQEQSIGEKDKKIEILLKRFKDWGLDESKIYEEPKRKRTNVEENKIESKESKKEVREFSKSDVKVEPKVVLENIVKDQLYLPITRRMTRRMLETNPVEEKRKDKKEKTFLMRHYDFDWAEVPVLLHYATSSSRLRRVGRRFKGKVAFNRVPTFSVGSVAQQIRDVCKNNGDIDKDIVETTEEKYFTFQQQSHSKQGQQMKTNPRRMRSCKRNSSPW